MYKINTTGNASEFCAHLNLFVSTQLLVRLFKGSDVSNMYTQRDFKCAQLNVYFRCRLRWFRHCFFTIRLNDAALTFRRFLGVWCFWNQWTKWYQVHTLTSFISYRLYNFLTLPVRRCNLGNPAGRCNLGNPAGGCNLGNTFIFLTGFSQCLITRNSFMFSRNINFSTTEIRMLTSASFKI